MKRSYFGIQTTFLIGIILSVLIIKYAIGFTTFMVLFWDFKSIMLVLGGVIAATHIHFTDNQFFKIFSRLRVAFNPMSRINLVNDIDEIIFISNTIKTKGITGILPHIEACRNPFMKLGTSLLYDKVSPKELQHLLKENIFYTQQRHFQGISFFQTMSNYSPSFGLLGTVIGLIKLLANLDSPELFGYGMSLAMITTFYGLFFSSFVFGPIAGRLQTLSNEEVLQKEMITIGLIGISNNENSFLIKEKLQNFISKQARQKLWKK